MNETRSLSGSASTSARPDLTGQVVIVTGGARGVGRGITEGFLAAGADDTIGGPPAPEAAPAVHGRAAAFVTADVRDPDDVERVVADVVARLGRVDVLVNNAGGSPPADSATASPRFSRSIIELNLVAPLVFSQAVYAVMKDQESGGAIVNIASVSGTRPNPGSVAYGAAKAGLLNMTQTLAVDFAPKVRVNAVTAGLILTEQAHLFYGDEEGIAAVSATVPLGRMGTPDDIAGVCLFLASPLAAYVSGANVLVHGGGEMPAYRDAAKNTRPDQG
jgi:NAD(P)-dependent dehydrogenase (short-subunit alcohol dehydrogenase family)